MRQLETRDGFVEVTRPPETVIKRPETLGSICYQRDFYTVRS